MAAAAARRFHRRVGKVLLGRVLLGGLGLALVFAIFQVALDYRHRIADLRQDLAGVEARYASALAEALWKMDLDLVDTQVAGIRGQPYIVRVAIVEKGLTTHEVGRAPTGPAIVREMPLAFEHRGVRVPLGTLKVEAEAGLVLRAAIDRFALILLFQLATVGITGAMLLAMFNRLVTRHLATASHYFETFAADGTDPPLRLEKEFLLDEIDFLVVSFNELRERLNALQRDLRQSEERYSTLFRANPAAVAVSRLDDNRLVDVNEAWETLTGYAREEVVGRPATAFGLWEDPERREQVVRMLRGQGQARVETQIRTKRGEQREILMSGEIIGLTGEGHLLTIGLDITERTKAQRSLQALNSELARSNAELERFASAVSHDLQEPLRMVASFTELLARRCGERLDDDSREYVRLAGDGAQRMQLMIDDLLLFSRVTTRGRAFEPVPLGEALGEALKNLALALEESGGAVVYDALPVVHGDRTQLMQLFQNLIGNAVKFRKAGEPPRIAIGARLDGPAGEGWTVSVRDNGIGIDPKHFERIFVVFQRLHTKEEYPGTGVGLAICKRIVDRHGGRIWVESTVGEGSTFYFTLPAAP